MKIGKLDSSKRVIIIAEIGNNHEGNFEQAVKLLHAAVDAGADCVKFQTFITDLYFNRHTDQARYDRLRKFELSQDQFRALASEAATRDVVFMSTPLDLESATFLNEIVPAFKIGSGENTFIPLLRLVATFAKPVIMSCGIAELNDIQVAQSLFEEEWNKGERGELALLHCVSSYPTPLDQVNLSAMDSLRSINNSAVGYSDHTLGITACLAAAARGARILEKHFTLDKRYSDFRDHQLSADPNEMSELVKRVREIELLLGSPKKQTRDVELAAKVSMRRSIVTLRNLPKGTILQIGDIGWTRPGGGFSPGEEGKVIGERLAIPLSAGEIIRPEHLKRN